MATASAQAATTNARTNTTTDHVARKGKAKKAADPAHTSKQIEDTIAQLERSRQGDKEQEMEIGVFVFFSPIIFTSTSQYYCSFIWVLYLSLRQARGAQSSQSENCHSLASMITG